jgi:flavin reductase (DIM6/NTAB) family NADH-FMN oxidoreductase RutF
MDEAVRQAVSAALSQVPSGLFVLTASHEDRRMGMLTTMVQQVCFDPPMICVAVAKGKPIMPLISESRQFGLCQISDADKIVVRKFAHDSEPGDDPFLGFELTQDRHTRVPVLASAMSYLECEVACHMDVEGDHDLFVGAVRNGGYTQGRPRIVLRDDSIRY